MISLPLLWISQVWPVVPPLEAAGRTTDIITLKLLWPYDIKSSVVEDVLTPEHAIELSSRLEKATGLRFGEGPGE